MSDLARRLRGLVATRSRPDGSVPIGTIEQVTEDERGLYVTVKMFEPTPVVPDAERRNLPAVVVILMMVAALLAVMAVIVLMPGQPCMEWDGWRFETIWPKPEGCYVPSMGE